MKKNEINKNLGIYCIFINDIEKERGKKKFNFGRYK